MRPLLLLGSLAALLACSQEKPAASAAPPPPPEPTAPAPIAWPAAFEAAASQPCPRTAARAASIHTRPQAEAPVFGQLAAGEPVRLLARTADGWVGFDPATAQAANVGIFRLRWVRATDAFGAAEPCAQLPVVAALPGGCLLMAARALPVRSAPRPDAPLLDSLPAGSYARVLPAARAAEWLPVAVPGRAQPGYVAAAVANLNGPCQ